MASLAAQYPPVEAPTAPQPRGLTRYDAATTSGTSAARKVSACGPAGTSVHSVSRGGATEGLIITSTMGRARRGVDLGEHPVGHLQAPQQAQVGARDAGEHLHRREDPGGELLLEVLRGQVDEGVRGQPRADAADGHRLHPAAGGPLLGRGPAGVGKDADAAGGRRAGGVRLDRALDGGRGRARGPGAGGARPGDAPRARTTSRRSSRSG